MRFKPVLSVMIGFLFASVVTQLIPTVKAQSANFVLRPNLERRYFANPEETTPSGKLQIQPLLSVSETLYSPLIKRFQAAISRLTQIGGRLDSRIAKLDRQDLNVTEAKNSLTKAQTLLNQAQVDLLNLSDKANNPEEDKPLGSQLRSISEDALVLREKLGQVKKELQTTLKLLPSANREVN